MQIRKQLRNAALAFGDKLEFPLCCRNRTCPSGYHGIHNRIRWKSRARHHGNATGQSKRAHK